MQATKKIVFVLILILIVTCHPVYAENTSVKVTNDTDLSGWNALNPQYYPFVYSNSSEFEWFREYIGPNDCEVGYLYAKDLTTGKITKLLSEPVKMFRETYDMIFCLTESDTLVQTDYLGQCSIQLYQAKHGQLGHIERIDATLIFTDGDHVISYDAVRHEVSTLAIIDNIEKLAPLTSTTFVWENANQNTYVFDATSATSTEITNEIEYCSMFTHISPTDVTTSNIILDAVPQNTADITAVNTSQSFPLSGLEVGKYFTNSGTACTHHGTGTCSYYGYCNCRSYANSIQCMGFAKYVSDQYAHRTSFTKPSGDVNSNIVYFSTDSDVRAYFNALVKGAYIRLSRSSADNVDGNHSIVFNYLSGSTISSYECNNDGQCGISMPSRSLYQLRAYYPYAIFSLSHHFDGTVSRATTTHHKIACSSSGCTGYIYKVHYAQNPGDNATCVACGYVGTIYTGIAD